MKTMFKLKHESKIKRLLIANNHVYNQEFAQDIVNELKWALADCESREDAEETICDFLFFLNPTQAIAFIKEE